MQNILDTILKTKCKEVAALRDSTDIGAARGRAEDAPQPRDFFAAVSRGPRRAVNLIAEIKKASPSAGVIRPDFDPVSIARSYATAGADAVSILTDEEYFQGSLEYLRSVRQAVDLPLLRKDFIIDPLQVCEARWSGADAVLLIAAALQTAELAELMSLANELSMACLVEVHNAAELSKVMPVVSGAAGNLLGINNRDLTTFNVDIATTVSLLGDVPAELPVVSESGIKTRDDVETLAGAGARAILVGETLMRSDDLVQAVEALLGPPGDSAGE